MKQWYALYVLLCSYVRVRLQLTRCRQVCPTPKSAGGFER